MRIAFPAEEGTLTPYTFRLGYPLMTLVYDTLTWRDANGVPQPWLAEAIETSPDGRTVTATLREARWHDGRRVTADDVAFTFRHLRERPHPRFTPQLEAVAGVEARDAATAVFHLHHPAPGFADQPLADVPIVPRHLWDGLPPDRLAPPGLPVGSGPYRLVARGDDGYRFRAQRGYFRGRPLAETIEAVFVPDLRRAGRALARGRIDMLPVIAPGPAPRGAELAGGTSYAGTQLVLNTRSAPFDDPALRRAAAQAIDLGAVTDAAGGGVAAEAGFLHPRSRWAPDGSRQRFDAPAARAAFAAGDPGEIEVLAPRAEPARAAAGRAVVAALRGVGAAARLRLLSDARLGRALGEDGARPSFQAAIWSVPALASYDPDFLRTQFGSDPVLATLNRSGYASPEFDAAAARTASTADAAARRDAVAAELDLLARDVPALPLFFADGAFAYRPGSYDRWVYVRGSGILDKRSFLPGPRPAAPAAGETPASGGDGLGPLGVAAIALAVAALAAAAAALVLRRR